MAPPGLDGPPAHRSSNPSGWGSRVTYSRGIDWNRVLSRDSYSTPFGGASKEGWWHFHLDARVPWGFQPEMGREFSGFSCEAYVSFRVIRADRSPPKRIGFPLLHLRQGASLLPSWFYLRDRCLLLRNSIRESTELIHLLRVGVATRWISAGFFPQKR